MAEYDNKVLDGAGVAKLSQLIKGEIRQYAPSRYFNLENMPEGNDQISATDGQTLSEMIEYWYNDGAFQPIKLIVWNDLNMMIDVSIARHTDWNQEEQKYDLLGFTVYFTRTENNYIYRWHAEFNADFTLSEPTYLGWDERQAEGISGYDVTPSVEFHPEITTVNNGFARVFQELDIMVHEPDFETLFMKGSVYRGYNKVDGNPILIAASPPKYTNEIVGKWKVNADTLRKDQGYYAEIHDSSTGTTPQIPGWYQWIPQYNSQFPAPFQDSDDFKSIIDSHQTFYTRMVINGEVEYSTWIYNGGYYIESTTKYLMIEDYYSGLRYDGFSYIKFADTETLNDYFISEIEVSLVPFVEESGGGLPDPPAANGNYQLLAIVNNGEVEYSWVTLAGVWQYPLQTGNNLAIYQGASIHQYNNNLEVV